MKFIAFMSLCGLALALAIPPVHAQTPQGTWYFCRLTAGSMGSPSKVYVSGVFQSEGAPDAISKAWDKYIVNKYVPDRQDLLGPGYIPPHCFAGRQDGLQDMHDRAVRGLAIDVDWKYK